MYANTAYTYKLRHMHHGRTTWDDPMGVAGALPPVSVIVKSFIQREYKYVSLHNKLCTGHMHDH